ncbi:hypothetical protein [Mesorhizobium sp.]|uniref:hypothetical protein n=1 Tax=Mesorhizobium sp. TaxID=1871066 RepID=UPI0012002027|nr:hypothetical protein [Mesorhizobium sp.]TIL31865.1 MAG: hypothetical protein E5Y85_19605 [Mesorhizobium sp.]TIL52636.1 MAG: hypothetical protein E5Y83_12055 [Mesorhizobium sp.]TIL62164.1 MAG: hypothetical protein E5Y79_04135 [Mesorhizobium sp.]TIL84407.1 MAG: hypothetical protein E5Y73_33545 [Mesorhizobium sp.]TIM47995.1 MAG: hypothetical protein E5Y56_07845 [Mesorhizobium sp.]
MIKADTPFALMLEMHAVVLGRYGAYSAGISRNRCIDTPFFSSSVGFACKLASGVGIMAVAVVLAQGAFLLGFGTLLEDPRYRSHFVCEPCF